MKTVNFINFGFFMFLISCAGSKGPSRKQTQDFLGHGPALEDPSEKLAAFDFALPFEVSPSQSSAFQRAKPRSQETRSPASQTYATFTGQADWRLLSFETPSRDFDVNEDLTSLTDEGARSRDAFAKISGIISNGAGNLLKVEVPAEFDESAPPEGALQQIVGNVGRLREKIRAELPNIRRLHQTVFFVPWPPDQRDLFHGNEKLSTEPGRGNVDLIGITPSNKQFQQFVTEQIKKRHEIFTQSVKRRASRGASSNAPLGQPFQILAARTAVVYTEKKVATIEATLLIALRPGLTPINHKLGQNLSLQEIVIPDVKERTLVAVVKLNTGFGVPITPWGRLQVEFGEFDQFVGVDFTLKPGFSFFNDDVRKNISPKIVVNFDGKIWPDAKAYLSKVSFDLGALKLENISSQTGFRMTPTIDADNYFIEKVNSTVQSKVDAAIRGELDHIIMSILGSGVEQ